MKKHFFILLLIFFSLTDSAFSQAVSRYIYVPISVDGNLTDWDFAEWTWFKPQDSNWKDSASFASFWDENYLYIAFQVLNLNLQAIKTERDEAGLHMDDGVEVLVDPNYDRSSEWQEDDFAYHVNVLNAILDDRGMNEEGKYNNDWDGKAITSVKIFGTVNEPRDIDKGYNVEIAIPWEEIGFLPAHGKKLGMDFCVNDRDNKSGEYRYYDWMKLKRFHMSSGFGTVILTF